MTEGPLVPARRRPVDLAAEADFALGSASVRPSLAEVVAAGRTIRLQPRVMQVLVALVRAAGEVVSRDDLVASCWGGLAIGDDAINRCIGALRRLGDEAAAGAFAIETLPRIGYRLTRLDAASEGPPAKPRRLTPFRLGLAAAIVAALAAGAWLELGRPGWPPRGEGVAVMAFDAPPGDSLAESFAAGLADEVASGLAKAELKSLPSDAGAGRPGPARDAAAIGLGAAFALSGRVQHDGEGLHVSVALDDPYAHEILWSADFTRPAAQAQAMQEQVAARVAAVLRCALDANSFAGGRMNRDHLRLYLRACEALNFADPETVRALFRQVVVEEPRLANAWAYLGLASALAATDLPPDLAAAARREASAAARRARQVDPKCGMAYVALDVATGTTGHLRQRQALLLQGLAVAPDTAGLYYDEAVLLGQAGRSAEAVAFERRAVMLDPLLPDFTADLAGALAGAGRLVEARAMIERAARIWPDDDSVLEHRIGFEARFGDPARALALLDDPASRPAEWEAPTIDDWRRFSIALETRDPAKVAAYVADVRARLAAGRMDASDAIKRFTPMGATDAAFAAAFAAPPEAIDTEILFRPSADAMRRDPRFMPLVARLGLVDFWRRTGRWPDFCRAPDRPYDCRAVAARLAAAR